MPEIESCEDYVGPTATISGFMTAGIKAGQWETCFTCFKELSKRRAVDTGSVNLMMRACEIIGGIEGFKKAWILFGGLLGENEGGNEGVFEGSTEGNLEADRYSYEGIIRVCVFCGQWEAASWTLGKALREGINLRREHLGFIYREAIKRGKVP